MKRYTFRPKAAILLVRETVDVLKRALGEKKANVKISLDLGLTKSEVKLNESGVVFPDGSIVELEILDKMKTGDVCMVKEGNVFKVAFYANGRYYRLLAVGPDRAPTLEVSGIHMHRIENITPWQDALEKVRALHVFDGARVLDIGTGLGYTSIIAYRQGAEVTTVEIDPHVLEMAEVNPWSHELAAPHIHLWLENAATLVPELPKNHFHRILHDPPRFALAGELYSKSFYDELFRVLKPGGWLYHYVGDPGKWRRKKLVAGVNKRLKEAGFETKKQAAAGIIARKP